MPVEYTYDEQRNLLLTRFSGVVTGEDVEKQAHAVAGDPRIRPRVRELVDLRAVESIEASADSIRTIVILDVKHRDKFRGHRTAIDAPSDMLHGASRMYELLSEAGEAPSVVKVFRTMEEACERLDLRVKEL